MPPDALSLLLTGVQPDKQRQAKRQKLNAGTEPQQSDRFENSSKAESPTTALSRDPFEVIPYSTDTHNDRLHPHSQWP